MTELRPGASPLRQSALSCYSMQMSKRRATLAMTLLLAATACGGGGDGEGATPSTTEVQRSTTSSSTTTKTEPVDPSVVPDDPEDINEEYVEAVLNAHNRVIGDALRLQLEGADISEIVDRYNAIYVPEVADGLLTNIIGVSEAVLSTLKQPPGDQQSRVVSIETATVDCIEALVIHDFSEVLNTPPPSAENVVVLRARNEPRVKSELNPTGWLSEGSVPVESAEGVTC